MLKLVTSALVFFASLPVLASTWEIDKAHSEVMFTARHLKFAKVRGNFRVWSGTAVIDEKDPSKSSVEVKFDIASIDTDNEMRDTHLKSADFFDVAKFPTATFKSTRLEKIKDGFVRVTGNLTIKDVTKPVTFQMEMSPEYKDPRGNPHIAFQDGKVTIVRQDYGLMWGKAVEGVGVVSDEIELDIGVELKNKK